MSRLAVDQSEKLKEINETLLMEMNLLKKENLHLKGISQSASVESLKKEVFMLKQELSLKDASTSPEQAKKHA